MMANRPIRRKRSRKMRKEVVVRNEEEENQLAQ